MVVEDGNLEEQSILELENNSSDEDEEMHLP